jgi:hypothetical protein
VQSLQVEISDFDPAAFDTVLPDSHTQLFRLDSICALCTSLPFLYNLDLGFAPPRFGLMFSITQQSHLTSLNMTLQDCSVNVLPLINELPSLTRLELEFETNNPDVFPLHTPIIRSSILHFSLVFRQVFKKITALMQYLAHCRIHPSAQVYLLLLSSCCKDISVGIVPFFGAHSFCKLEIAVHGEKEDNRIEDVGDVVAQIPHVAVIDPNLVNGLLIINFALPSILELECGSSDLAPVWQFFDRLLGHLTGDNSCHKKTSTIRMHRRFFPSLLWLVHDPVDEDEVLFIGRSLRYGLLLYNHGIYVVDQEWKDTRAVLRAPPVRCACGLH